MNKIILTGVIFFGLGMGFSSLLFLQSENNDPENSMGMNMSHPMFEVDDLLPVPSVAVEAIKDTKDGYNLHITTENYRFAPENVNSEIVQGEGHAHIYVNGAKVARLYGEWFNLPSSVLQDGENIIMVTLNANDHSEWSQNGRHISATTNVTK